jgi:protein gp37
MTTIEWTDRTWNPVTGCTKVSPGCDHCYAEGIARRFAGTKAFPQGFDVTLRPERLGDPLKWRKPRRVFVNSMSDLFHQDVPNDFIAQVWAVMAATPQHTYQVLTKRPARMRSLLLNAFDNNFTDFLAAELFRLHEIGGIVQWPLPNVWLGVSVEDQKRADLRIPALLDTPAAVRFLSCEPLLGHVDLESALNRFNLSNVGLGWVIVGGESGPGARRMELDWAQHLVGQCQQSGVPVFVKQLGSAHGKHKGGDMTTWPEPLRIREYPQAVS